MNIESDHFKTLEELMNTIKMWVKNEEEYYSRYFGLNEMNILVNEIERLHSIIKEIREYIKNNDTTFKVNEVVNAFGIPSIEFTIEPWKKDVLEILDKVKE